MRKHRARLAITFHASVIGVASSDLNINLAHSPTLHLAYSKFINSPRPKVITGVPWLVPVNFLTLHASSNLESLAFIMRWLWKSEVKAKKHILSQSN